MFVLQLGLEDKKKDSAWFDVGIIKGTSCTVSSYYLPNGDLEKSEIDIEVNCSRKCNMFLNNTTILFLLVILYLDKKDFYNLYENQT